MCRVDIAEDVGFESGMFMANHTESAYYLGVVGDFARAQEHFIAEELRCCRRTRGAWYRR